MEFFDCTEDSLPLYDLSMDSIYFDSHEGYSLDMDMSQDQDPYDTNDNKDDVIIDPFPCITNATLHHGTAGHDIASAAKIARSTKTRHQSIE